MRLRTPLTRRRGASLLLGGCLVATGLVATTPARAASAVTDGATAPQVLHPDSDVMGSTIAAHEPAARPAVAAAAVPAGPQGTDVSHWQGNVDWAQVSAKGGRFAYVKATESTTYVNPYFSQQYNGSYAAGLVHGAYHFALPDRSSGVAQAAWFVTHGGGWSADGRTLPPLLDIEYNPYGADCYGLSPTAMSAWIRAFSSEVKRRTGRAPAIYTTTSWWNTCTAGDTHFGASNPLFIARWSSTPYPLPAGWKDYRLWQYAVSGAFPGDQDVFHGTVAGLRTFAKGRAG